MRRRMVTIFVPIRRMTVTSIDIVTTKAERKVRVDTTSTEISPRIVIEQTTGARGKTTTTTAIITNATIGRSLVTRNTSGETTTKGDGPSVTIVNEAIEDARLLGINASKNLVANNN